MRLLSILILCALFMAAPAAQCQALGRLDPSTVEFGVVARATSASRAAGSNAASAGGARMMLRVGDNTAIDFEGTFANASRQDGALPAQSPHIGMTTARARLDVPLLVARTHTLMLGVGGVVQHYQWYGDGPYDGAGGTGLMGVRIMPTSPVTLRLEAVGDLIHQRDAQGRMGWHPFTSVGLAVGVSARLLSCDRCW